MNELQRAKEHFELMKQRQATAEAKVQAGIEEGVSDDALKLLEAEAAAGAAAERARMANWKPVEHKQTPEQVRLYKHYLACKATEHAASVAVGKADGACAPADVIEALQREEYHAREVTRAAHTAWIECND